MDTKVCSRCGIEKPLTDFNKNNKNKGNNGLQYSCRECDRTYLKDYYTKTKPKHKEEMAIWRNKNKDHLDDYEKNRRPNKNRRSSDSKYRQRRWRKTEKGKAHNKRHNHKRRLLGSNELFPNVLDESEHPISHHVSENYIVWLPDDIHRLFDYSPDVTVHRENLLPIIKQLYPDF